MNQEHISYKDFREGKYDKGKKPLKYRNHKTLCDGRLFHSQKEANHYKELRMLKQAGLIVDFLCQVDLLIEGGYYKNEGTPKEEWVKPVFYRTDFLVDELIKIFNPDGTLKDCLLVREVQEVKGMWTEEAKIKWKIVQDRYPQYQFKVI